MRSWINDEIFDFGRVLSHRYYKCTGVDDLFYTRDGQVMVRGNFNFYSQFISAIIQHATSFVWDYSAMSSRQIRPAIILEMCVYFKFCHRCIYPFGTHAAQWFAILSSGPPQSVRLSPMKYTTKIHSQAQHLL